MRETGGKGLRGTGINLPHGGDKIGLPARPFLYTIDQIATLLHVDEKAVKTSYLYYEGRSAGSRGRDLMIARNIAPVNATPDWRIAERELVRWLKYKGFRYYEAGAVSN